MKVNCEVFISYSSKEKEMADLVRETLDNNGLSCWMAPESIPASSVMPQKLLKQSVIVRLLY